MSAKRRLYFPKVMIHLGVVALVALALQLLAIKAPLGDDLPRRVLIVVSYALLLVFVAFNIRRPGLLVIGLGLCLNLLPIVVHGGLMPITPETILRTGALPEGVSTGDWIPGSKDVLLAREDVHLWFLTDRLVWDDISSVFRAFSLGDLVIVAGLAVTLADLFIPRLKQASEQGTAPR